MASQPTSPEKRFLEVFGLRIRAYENPLVSLKKGRLLKNPILYVKGVYVKGGHDDP